MVAALTPSRRVLLAGAALVAAAWVVTRPPSPPLYDGIIGPAEPYRYLNPPPGATTHGQPSSASTTVAVSSSGSAAGFLNTSEQPPQVQFLVGEGALVVPAGSTSVTLTVTPVEPPIPLPAADGRFDGNAYEVTATADKPGTVTVRPGGTPPTIVMRGPPGSNSAVVYRHVEGGSWQPLHTVPIGGQAPDIQAANTDQLGWFALVLSSTSSSSTSTGGSGGSSGFPVVAVVIPLVVLLVLAGVIVSIRLSRSPTQRR